MAICSICGREHKDERRNRCNSCTTKIRRIRMKMRAVKYLGGKCVKCGQKVHFAAFQFHHKDSNNKEFNVGRVMNKSWDSIVPELDKCELLCANCHAEMHSTRYEDVALVRIAMTKKKEKILRKKYFCIDCGQESPIKSRKPTRCKKCHIEYVNSNSRKPSKEILTLLKNKKIAHIAKKYSVSWHTAKKWIMSVS